MTPHLQFQSPAQMATIQQVELGTQQDAVMQIDSPESGTAFCILHESVEFLGYITPTQAVTTSSCNE